MAGKVCPILSAGVELRYCIGNECMMYHEGQSSGNCIFAKTPLKIGGKIDTLSAQIQEIQVALIKLTNA